MKNAITHHQVMYNALRGDFEKERRHVDAVLSFYDESKAQVVHSAGCHRIALSAKSSLLRNLLIAHQVGSVLHIKLTVISNHFPPNNNFQDSGAEKVKIVIVGNFDRGGAEDLVSRFYDVPETSDGQADVDLWSVERKQRIHADPLSEDNNISTESETNIVDVK